MDLYLEKFAEGVKQALADHQQGHNIFEIKGGSMFPHHDTQRLWQYSRAPGHVHFTDGTNTYSFKGELHPDNQTELEKLPDVPLPDMYMNSTARGKAQVHRSNPGSLYFTLQEGKQNPTYTFRHSGENKWVAIPKSRKAKKQMAEEPFVPNINLDQVKAGMENEVINHAVTETDGGSQSFFKQALVGEALQGLANLPASIALAPARAVGGPLTYLGDQSTGATESFPRGLLNAGVAGAAGAGLGALYHMGKRNLYNTPEENAAEDPDHELKKRMAIPAAAMAGLNVAGRSMFPGAVNNPDWKMFG